MGMAMTNSRKQTAIRALAIVAALALVAGEPGRQPLQTRRLASKTFRLTLR